MGTSGIRLGQSQLQVFKVLQTGPLLPDVMPKWPQSVARLLFMGEACMARCAVGRPGRAHNCTVSKTVLYFIEL